jgi:asparagine synthase (glutamine-hydrolysing)
VCGICGKYYYESGGVVTKEEIERMRDIMLHRGPDDSGLYLTNNLGLGHRRLSIIDLSTGKQPIYNEDGSIVIVFNGEIYNFKELRDYLLKKGHKFETKTDTEVIIHLYEEKGVECLNYFRGMFAFAIWDNKKKALFLARDRLGIKPLYYYKNDKVFVFASEIKALLQHPEIKSKINQRMLARCLKYRFVYGQNTLFEGIYELLPGNYMVVGRSGIKIAKYWDVPYDDFHQDSFEKVKDQLLCKINKSVGLRMISDVPIGLFLSGGVDSSLVAAMMSGHAKRIKTFSIGFYPQELNELRFAKTVSDLFQSEHYEYIISASDYYALLKKLIWHNDEPLMFPASIPLYILSKHSKDNATVMLAGEGADELYGGYLNNIKAYWLDRLSKNTPIVLKNAISKIKFGRKYDDISKKILYKDEDLILSFFQLISSIDILNAVDWNTERDAIDDGLWDEIGAGGPGRSFLEKLLYFQLKTYLVALLMKQDKMSMAASIETRVPFLDHHLVEFSWKIPDYFKIKRNEGKYILKKACEKILPKEIVYRKKMGFPVPIKDWLLQKENPFIQVLLDKSTTQGSFFKKNYINKAVENLQKGKDANINTLWTLINLELWRREFL